MSDSRIRGFLTLVITVVVVIGGLFWKKFLIVGRLVTVVDPLKTAISFVFVFWTCLGSVRGRSANTTQLGLQGAPRQIGTAKSKGRF